MGWLADQERLIDDAFDHADEATLRRALEGTLGDASVICRAALTQYERRVDLFGSERDPDAQRAGAATALLAALEEIAAQRFDEIRLEASPSSVEFYAGRGYRPVGHDRLEIGQAGFRFVHMTKNVGGTDTSAL